MTMKMRLEKKNTSRKYDIKRPRHAHEYSKCKNLGWFKTMISYHCS